MPGVLKANRDNQTLADGLDFSREEMTSLVDEFSHDARTPLTIISEFASMLWEGVIHEAAEREQATAVICERVADTLQLVDVLQLLVQATCEEIATTPTTCTVKELLSAAASEIERSIAPRDAKVTPGLERARGRVRCDPQLAALTLFHLWCRVSRTHPRDQPAVIDVRPTPPANDVVIVVAKCDVHSPTAFSDCERFYDDGQRLQDEPPAFPQDLRLRLASELGRLAGGAVSANQSGSILRLPRATDSVATTCGR